MFPEEEDMMEGIMPDQLSFTLDALQQEISEFFNPPTIGDNKGPKTPGKAIYIPSGSPPCKDKTAEVDAFGTQGGTVPNTTLGDKKVVPGSGLVNKEKSSLEPTIGNNPGSINKTPGTQELSP